MNKSFISSLHPMQFNVWPVSHGHKGKWSVRSPDYHLLPVDDLHRCHRRHCAGAHHSSWDGVGERRSPCKHGTCYDLGWRVAGPHQVNIYIWPVCLFICDVKVHTWWRQAEFRYSLNKDKPAPGKKSKQPKLYLSCT